MTKDKTIYDATFFQTVSTRNIDRSDHVWWLRFGRYKCVLCGAVCAHPPPYRPVREDWMPDIYEKVTKEDKDQCPLVDIDLGIKRM